MSKTVTEVQDMCNLGTAIERKGIEIGEKRGIDIGKLALATACVKSGKMSMEDAAGLLKMTVEEFTQKMNQLPKEVVNA